jgi:hypothetical protein
MRCESIVGQGSLCEICVQHYGDNLTGTPRDQMLLKYYALLTFSDYFYQLFCFLLPDNVPPLLCIVS